MSETGLIDILLVEDSDSDAELTMRALQKKILAARIHRVEDGEAALEFLRRPDVAYPRVILLDLKMPRVDGMEVLRELKGDARTRAIPIVVLTSSREDPDLKAAYALGANSYIVKPVDFVKFSTTVAELGLYWLSMNEPSVTGSPSAAAPVASRVGGT